MLSPSRWHNTQNHLFLGAMEGFEQSEGQAAHWAQVQQPPRQGFRASGHNANGGRAIGTLAFCFLVAVMCLRVFEVFQVFCCVPDRHPLLAWLWSVPALCVVQVRDLRSWVVRALRRPYPICTTCVVIALASFLFPVSATFLGLVGLLNF